MNYEDTIISKVMESNVVFIDNKTIKDRYNKPEIEDYMTALDDVDNKYNIVSWDEDKRILKLKTII
jgi:hypothetical protein